METKNKTNFLGFLDCLQTLRSSIFWIGLFAACYVAVLPMADTIALRNVVLLALLGCLIWEFPKIRPEFKWGVPVLLWIAYLFFFPLIADDHLIAWQSFLGQWGRGLLAMLAGAGVAIAFTQKNRGGIFYLGLLSGISILVNLALFAWKGWTTKSIPWGYWGRETHHADLGYAAGHTVILLAAAIAAGNKKVRSLAIAVVIAAILSTALARSRAGLAFAVLGGVLVFAAAYLGGPSTQARRYVLFGLAGLLLAGAGVVGVAVKDDSRWRTMASELAAGFYGDAIQLQCKGTASIEPQIMDKYGESGPRVIASVQYGDGSRMVALRVGLALALKHPWGSDGSRQAFQKLLRQECPTPAISMAHTHNGWLDTVLAVGWIGAALYLAVLLYFFKQGWSHLRREKRLNEWALVLVSLSVFWVLRGFTDSVFRDHMLEMQGFVLAFAAVTLRLQIHSEERRLHSAQAATKTPRDMG